MAAEKKDKRGILIGIGMGENEESSGEKLVLAEVLQHILNSLKIITI